MKDKPFYPPQAGSVLIIAMFIVVVIALVISIVAFIVLNGLRSSGRYSFAMRSYYAAESGIESGLYYTVAARSARIISASASTTTVSGLANQFTNDAAYDVQATILPGGIQASLTQGQSVQMDLFQEATTTEYELLPLSDTQPVTMQFQWDEQCPSPGTSKIEVSFARWSSQQWQDYDDATDFQNKYVVLCPGGADGFTCSYEGIGLEPGFLYKMRVKALECDLPRISIAPLNTATGDPIDTANYIQIQSQGTIARTSQTITATFPWRAPITDYFDYVLFTERPLFKETGSGTVITIPGPGGITPTP